MFANEMPQIKEAGSFLRLGLYAFCVVSFLNYLLPVLFRHMGWWVFLLAWILSIGITVLVVKKVIRYSPPSARAWTLKASPAAVLLLIFVLYFSKLIPPVPLSVQYMGIFHGVEKHEGRYKLIYRKPLLLQFLV
jgi:hypothetical protein